MDKLYKELSKKSGIDNFKSISFPEKTGYDGPTDSSQSSVDGSDGYHINDQIKNQFEKSFTKKNMFSMYFENY